MSLLTIMGIFNYMNSACRALNYFRDLVNDTLFIRVCIALSGLFFAGLIILGVDICFCWNFRHSYYEGNQTI